ncbi:hypothetical protein V5N11_000903 [Cardamine amara subsp. amara]|uniref:DUF1677 family protein n=1 Tax=Cardamine amara subsp. amara TaxID=228776 RepID=A0ABD1C562_CARAN
MSEGNLRKAFSDVSERIISEKDEQEQEGEQEVKEVKCDCCSIEEECTLQYIDKVKDLYSGKWVCGLCAEVVTERCRKRPPAATRMQEALDWHRGFIESFNSTTRVNPKLYFTKSMREIARRSHQNRTQKFSLGSKIARTTSCDPRLET